MMNIHELKKWLEQESTEKEVKHIKAFLSAFISIIPDNANQNFDLIKHFNNLIEVEKSKESFNNYFVKNKINNIDDMLNFLEKKLSEKLSETNKMINETVASEKEKHEFTLRKIKKETDDLTNIKKEIYSLQVKKIGEIVANSKNRDTFVITGETSKKVEHYCHDKLQTLNRGIDYLAAVPSDAFKAQFYKDINRTALIIIDGKKTNLQGLPQDAVDSALSVRPELFALHQGTVGNAIDFVNSNYSFNGQSGLFESYDKKVITFERDKEKYSYNCTMMCCSFFSPVTGERYGILKGKIVSIDDYIANKPADYSGTTTDFLLGLGFEPIITQTSKSTIDFSSAPSKVQFETSISYNNPTLVKHIDPSLAEVAKIQSRPGLSLKNTEKTRLELAQRLSILIDSIERSDQSIYLQNNPNLKNLKNTIHTVMTESDIARAKYALSEKNIKVLRTGTISDNIEKVVNHLKDVLTSKPTWRDWLTGGIRDKIKTQEKAIQKCLNALSSKTTSDEEKLKNMEALESIIYQSTRKNGFERLFSVILDKLGEGPKQAKEASPKSEKAAEVEVESWPARGRSRTILKSETPNVGLNKEPKTKPIVHVYDEYPKHIAKKSGLETDKSNKSDGLYLRKLHVKKSTKMDSTGPVASENEPTKPKIDH